MTQLCQCKQKGTRFCENHWIIFCDQCKCQEECKLNSIQSIDINNEYQKFKKQKMNFIYEQKNFNEQIFAKQITKLEKLKKNIQNNLEFLKNKKNEFIKTYVNVDLDGFKHTIDQNFQNKKWDDTFAGIKELKVKMDEFKDSSTKIALFEQNNCLIATFNEIFQDLDDKFQKQFQFVLSFKLENLQDFIQVANKVQEMYFQHELKTQEEIKQKVKFSSKLANTIKLESTQIKKTIMINEDSNEDTEGEKSLIESFGSDELELESDNEQKFNKKSKRKATKLISNNIFQSSLNPKLIDIPRTQVVEETMSLEKSLSMSFDVQDIELEEDIESLEQDFEQDFLNTKNKFCLLLDQVLYDVNCVNFFEKSERNKLNDYFEQFRICINQLTVDIKNNFSKM